MIVISDTSPIIYFAKIGQLQILKDLYSKIYVPDAVWEELVYPLSRHYNKIPKDIKYALRAKEEGWIIIKNPETIKFYELALELSKNLGRGEAHAIALSLEINADLLLINDKMAKNIAELRGINTKWNAAVLLEAYEKNLFKSYQEFKINLDKMIESGLWIEKSLYEELLNKAKTIK
ncbi:MAG: hypothetical protein GF329_13595 [Candidatus Lokiarchaeota archaeon]|nr:hypothetical protein [Candidatus Lokiarchaeota archaeon]